MRVELSANPRARCSLSETPLARFNLRVKPDPLNRAVAISFTSR
jgi:hypothetical protein